eukprot:RCo052582
MHRLVSIRACSLTFFVAALVVTTVSVVAVMVVYSSNALADQREASTRAAALFSTSTAAILANVSERSTTALVHSVGLSTSTMMSAFAASQDQVLTMSAELLSRNLGQFVSNLQSFLGSVQNAMEVTYMTVTSAGTDLNSLDQALALAPYVLSSLHYERTTTLSFLGPLTGVIVSFMDVNPSVQGYPPLAIVAAGTHQPFSTYAVNTTSLHVLYPSSSCYRGFVYYCNFSISIFDSGEFKLASNLAAGDLQYSVLQIAPGAIAFKYVSIVTAVRSSGGT